VYVCDQVPESALNDSYGSDYYEQIYNDYLSTAEQRISGFRRRLASIEKYFARPGNLLDYGCAVGLFVKVAKEAGWAAKGYERSTWAADYGRNVLGVDIELGDGRKSSFQPESFDVVTLWDVVEHLSNPRRVLESVKSWLCPGGIAVVTTVNSSSVGAWLAGKGWRHLGPPHHLQYFSRRSLMYLLRAYGFQIKSVVGEGAMFSAKGKNAAPDNARHHLDQVVRYWRLRPLVTALNLLDEISIVAMKSLADHTSKTHFLPT
jgi:SAM-dependent methyltransferase